MTVTVGVLAGPGLPLKIAAEVAEELPRAPERQFSAKIGWNVGVRRRRLVLTEDGEVPVAECCWGWCGTTGRSGWCRACRTRWPRRRREDGE